MAIPYSNRYTKLAAASIVAFFLYYLAISNSLLETPRVSFQNLPAIRDDAHRLPTADDFLTHFEAVMRAPGMTIAQAKAGCNWPDEGKVNFQFGPDYDWAVEDRSDWELRKRRNQWHRFMRNGLIPYAPHAEQFQGKGVVIVAGDSESMKRVRVVLRALKKLESKVPVELHYWGDEVAQTDYDEVMEMWDDIRFNDLSAPHNLFKATSFIPSPKFPNLTLPNYSFKTAAMINSRFAEPLLLDSDNIPVIAPEELWNSETYKEYGSVFWPDIARTRPQNPVWPITNTACRMDEWEQESGQLLVDKTRFFYHLQLAAWFNNEQGSYYAGFLLGDKDTFRFAWHALKTQYGRPSRWLTSVGTLAPEAFDKKDNQYCGHSFAQHHPDHSDGRVAFMHGGLLKTMDPKVMTWQRTRGGVYQVYKRAPRDEDKEYNMDVTITGDAIDYWKDKPEGTKAQWCTRFRDVTAKPLEEIIPGGFEQTFEDVGGYWMLNMTHQRPH
ncbi:hypothetical protein KC357_g8058 [Hortaea werneckii]|nr:hypothetical protein KC357_g8058 [Hortaea werneckii]